MKRLFYLLFTLILGLSIWSCEYDDDDLWKEVEQIKTQLTVLNKEVSTLQGLVDALQKSKIISELEETDDGYSLHFTDGTSLEIKNGQAGKDAPVIGIAQHEGVYYWTFGGADKWLVDDSGNKIQVAGKDGHSPALAVDAEGYWTLDGIRITGPDGKTVKAVGKDGKDGQDGAAGKDGDSFFESVVDGVDQVTVKLTDGTEITLPKIQKGKITLVGDEGEFVNYYFAPGEERKFKLVTTGMSAVDKMNTPEGWTVKVAYDKKEVTVKAPAGTGKEGGILTLVGITETGATVFASAGMYPVDYSDVQGTFVVCEGNMSTVNGTLVYYDRNGKEYTEVFEKANGGDEIGNVVQDMYMANGKIYLLTQNGNSMGGAGRFVVCDAATMKLIFADPLVITTPEGNAAWPQHLVVASPTKAYVQYAESGMETTSGICTLELGSSSVAVGNTIEGTFGQFAVAGASKARMVLSRDKIFAGGGQRLMIIDVATGKLEKTLDYPGQQVKGVVKGADGNIYFALTGTFTGIPNNAQLTGPAQIVGIDHRGQEIQRTNMPEGIKLSTATWTPAVGMCASFTEPYLYFVDTDEFMCMTASRYNYESKAFEVNYVRMSNTLYGIMGVHPFTGELWIPTSDYVSSDIYVYDAKGSAPQEIRHFRYSNQKGASPAGVDFAYRFSQEYVEK